jgi:hypothetical protein
MTSNEGTMSFEVEPKSLEAFKAMCATAGLKPELVLAGFINKVVRPPSWVHWYGRYLV